ncbi:MAG: prepilin-type N-terminal cleavage/methylation domain-containing protein [Verrucomicrobiales bacterium]|jgi:prepilin-type N-terminal cleavage/methylation domain-containing protein
MIIRANRRCSGFTLVELVGVMAILAILASIAVPQIVKQIDRARLEEEREELTVLGEALQRQVISSRTIPDESWSTAIASDLAITLEQVETTSARFERIYLTDPEMQIGTGPAVLPYTQAADGSSARPENVRVMLVSSHGLALPDLRAKIAANPDAFGDLWDTPEAVVPAGWPSEWAGEGDRLLIYRIDLSHLFCRLIINSLTASSPPVFSIDDGDPYVVSADHWSSYYFKETAIGFYNNAQLEARDLLMEDRSYVYEGGLWRGRLREGKGSESGFAQALDAFLSSRLSGNSPPGVTQQVVVDAYHHFILTYATWAQAEFPDVTSHEFQAMVQARDELQLRAGYLIEP